MTTTKFRVSLLIVLGLFTALQTSSTIAQNGSTPLALKPCEIKGINGPAKCGTLEVFENRATRKGRKININVLVLPATGPQREPDPLFYFAGGPGGAATEDAVNASRGMAKIRERRDLVFVDQRGAGGSNGFNCPLYDPNDQQSYLGYFYPLEAVRKCRERLEPRADLTLYTTTIAVDDIDDVRAALGYDKINLFGGSYGTRASMVYVRRHPKNVRAVWLQGISLTNQYLPRDYPRDTERALQGILSECAADEACNKAFPDLKNESKAVLDRLIKGPVEAEIKPPDAAAPFKVSLSRDLAAEAIRYMLYHPQLVVRIPLYLHLAAAGNFAPLAEWALYFRKNLVGPGSNGLFLSVTCAEDVPWIKRGEGELLAENTFLGEYRLQQQREACALWPRAKIDSDYTKPVTSDLPVLIVTGEWDPVTPPKYAEALSRTLKNSLQVVVPQGGHGLGGLDGINCLEGLTTKFIETGSTNGLDTSCIKTIRRRPFALK